jgi:hypothetical protein
MCSKLFVGGLSYSSTPGERPRPRKGKSSFDLDAVT